MRQAVFSRRLPLDRFRPRAQDRSYTNERARCRREGSNGQAGHWLANMAMEVTATSGDKIRCDACPVMCYIKPGAAGACDRYANHDGQLVRVDPHIVLERTVEHGGRVVPFQAVGDWDGKIVNQPDVFVTAIGAGTTYPDYKPAPFIVSSEVDGVDMVTVVTEGIFSYCGAKLKVDTDRHLGPERNLVRAKGEPVGHVTTGE